VSFVLREILNRAWFLNAFVVKEQVWLSPTDLQADAFKGVKTSENTLSVYELVDDAAATVDRALAALAATREHVPQLDYVLLNRAILNELRLETRRTLGETPDAEVNTWHLDVKQLNSTRLTDLCNAIRDRGRFFRRRPKQVARLVYQALEANRLDRGQIKPELLESVKRLTD
jgi:hypothetical protein